MTTTIDIERLTSPPLDQSEIEMGRVAERFIMESIDRSRAAKITIESIDGSMPSVEVSPKMLRVIAQTLGLMASGQRVTLVSEKDEFTTVEAAHFLNVSRPFVIKEIESGNLTCRMVGSHRRIAFSDLTDYAEKMKKRSKLALDAMAENARDLGLGY